MAYSIYRIPTLDSGWVLDVSPRLLNQSSGYTRKLVNMDTTALGILRKRGGTEAIEHYTLPEGSQKGYQNLHVYKNLKADFEVLLSSFTNGSIAGFDDGSGSWVNIINTLSDEHEVKFLTYDSQVLMVNGDDPSMIWDGTALNTPVDFPICSLLAEWRGRVVAAGIPDDPCLVKMSHATDPNIWNPAATGSNATQFYIGPDDGEPVTGLLNTGEGGLLITKPSQIYGIFGYTRQDMTAELLDTTVGSTSPKSLAYARPNAYFCGKDGVYCYKGGGVSKISAPIQSFWDRHVEKTLLHKAVGFIYNRKYMLTVDLHVENTVTLVYDIDQEKWSGYWDYPRFKSVAVNGEDMVLFVPYDWSTTIHTLTPDTDISGNYGYDYSDEWSIVEAEVETQQIDMELPELDKDVNNAYLIFQATDEPYVIKALCYVDGKCHMTEPFIRKVEGERGTQVVHRMHIGTTGKFFSFKLWNDLNQDFRPLAISLSYRPKELI